MNQTTTHSCLELTVRRKLIGSVSDDDGNDDFRILLCRESLNRRIQLDLYRRLCISNGLIKVLIRHKRPNVMAYINCADIKIEGSDI